MENPIKIDDLGVPLFSETPIFKLGIMSLLGHFQFSCAFLLWTVE